MNNEPRANDDLYDLEKINQSQKQTVGEKSIELSELLKQGYPILPTLVVGSEVLRSILNEKKGFEDLFTLDVNRYENLQQTAKQLSSLIAETSLQKEWCEEIFQRVSCWKSSGIMMRPSLVLPPEQKLVEGLLESHCCGCDQSSIELGLKEVWQSLFRARSLFYCQKQEIDWKKLGLAVIIQPLNHALVSGKVEVKGTQWMIQSVRGLGYSLVRGEVLPEVYEINGITKEVQHYQPGYQTRLYNFDQFLNIHSLEEEADQTILSSEQLSQLLSITTKLKQIYEHDFKWEWVFFSQSPWKEEINTPQLYLTQFYAYSSPKMAVKMSQQATSGLIVKGIGSATGRSKGKVYIVGRDDEKAFPQGGILVTKSITTQCLPLIKTAGGLITELGGMTSHGAILARELSIPAVVGAKGAIEALEEESEVTVDGDQGEVLRSSEGEEIAVEKRFWEESGGEVSLCATQLMVNLSQPDRAIAVSELPVDGVGLLRSELMLLELLGKQSLSRWLSPGSRDDFIQHLVRSIGQFAEAFYPRPVFYRSTDWLTMQEVDASFLGERGTYGYLENSELFSAQMFALRSLQNQGYMNINLILPFVRDLNEVNFCKKILTEIGVKESCEVWIMGEVPSVVYLLPEYIEAGIKGIAIGTNDLTQLLLGVDREEGELRKRYNERHPVVLSVLEDLIKTAKAGGIDCSICGQGVILYPELVEDLVRWGVNKISVEASGVEKVMKSIARSEKRILLEAARQQLRRVE